MCEYRRRVSRAETRADVEKRLQKEANVEKKRRLGL